MAGPDKSIIGQFLEDLAEPRPDPGGGAAAAYGALVGLALARKVGRLEVQRDRADDSAREFWVAILSRIDELESDLLVLLRADGDAYARLAEAKRSLHGETETHPAIRASVDPTLLMMESAQRCLDCVSLMARQCRRHLISDLQVAIEFMGAAIEGAFRIAAANAKLVRPAGERASLSRELETVRERGRRQVQSVRDQLATC